MKLIEEQAAFTQDIAKLIIKAFELGYVLTQGEAWRPETQAWINSLPSDSQLIAISPDGSKKQFGARVGGTGILKSKHGDRLAKDFNIFKAGNFSRICTLEEARPLGEYWQSLNPKNRYGGFFTTRVDTPHFERNIS